MKALATAQATAMAAVAAAAVLNFSWISTRQLYELSADSHFQTVSVLAKEASLAFRLFCRLY